VKLPCWCASVNCGLQLGRVGFGTEGGPQPRVLRQDRAQLLLHPWHWLLGQATAARDRWSQKGTPPAEAATMLYLLRAWCRQGLPLLRHHQVHLSMNQIASKVQNTGVGRYLASTYCISQAY
jgi:hypothetical protein